MTTLCTEQKEAFVRDGFVILPGFIPPEMADKAEKCIDTAYAKGQYNKMVKKLLGADQPTPNFYRPVKQAPEIMDLMYKTGLFEIANELLGQGNAVVRDELAQIAVTFKCEHWVQAGRGLQEPHPKFKWHIDAGQGKYAAEGTDFSLLMGVALSEGQEIDENRGQFVIWPGSHVLTHSALASALKKSPETEEEKEVMKRFAKERPKCGEPQRTLLRRGDAFIAHQRLAHAPGVNLTDVARKNVYFRIVHAFIDDILEQQMVSPTPWVGFAGLKEFLQEGATEYSR